jgi:hypothetical protein
MKKMMCSVAALLLFGCVTPNPRGVIVKQDQNSGSIALFNEDDVEPSQHIAQKDAERQMAQQCKPRGYKIVGKEKFDTGNTVNVAYGYGVGTSQRILVNQLNYVCVDK